MNSKMFLVPLFVRIAFCFSVVFSFFIYGFGVSDLAIFISRSMAIAAFLIVSGELIFDKLNLANGRVIFLAAFNILLLTCAAGIAALAVCVIWGGYDLPIPTLTNSFYIISVLATIFLINTILLLTFHGLKNIKHIFFRTILIAGMLLLIVPSPFAFFRITNRSAQGYRTPFMLTVHNLETTAQSLSFSLMTKKRATKGACQFESNPETTYDGWGNSIEFTCMKVPGDEICEVLSFGADGRKGGTGVNKDLIIELRESESGTDKILNFKRNF